MFSICWLASLATFSVLLEDPSAEIFTTTNAVTDHGICCRVCSIIRFVWRIYDMYVLHYFPFVTITKMIFDPCVEWS